MSGGGGNGFAEWQRNGGGEGLAAGGRASRYPIHDACEFEDAEALRRLIYVPIGSSDDDGDGSSISSDGDSFSSSASSRGEGGEAAAVPPLGGDPLTENGGGEKMAEAPSPRQVGVEPPPPSGGVGASPGMTGPGQSTHAAPQDSDNDAMKIDDMEAEGGSMTKKDDIVIGVPEGSGQHVSPETPPEKLDGGNDDDGGQSASGKAGASAVGGETEGGKAATSSRAPKFSCPYDLDERDDDENTPLHVAIHARRIECVRTLLEAGATVHKKCDGSAPVHLAIGLGAIPAHAEFAAECVGVLRDYNADLTMRDDSFHTYVFHPPRSGFVLLVCELRTCCGFLN